MWFLYMIQNKCNKLYIGISQNPVQRLQHHNKRHGSTFTRFGEFEIIFLEKHENISSARKREIQIKKWSRNKKNFLINLYQQGKETKI